MIFLGGLLLVFGFFLGFVPVVPGFVLAIPGIAILCSRSKIAAKLLDAAERLFRKIRCRRKSPINGPTPASNSEKATPQKSTKL